KMTCFSTTHNQADTCVPHLLRNPTPTLIRAKVSSMREVAEATHNAPHPEEAVERPSRRIIVRRLCGGRASRRPLRVLLSMREVAEATHNAPHPEEAAQRPSRRIILKRLCNGRDGRRYSRGPDLLS